MLVNRQQCCSILGLTRAEFDRLLPLGFPARKKSSSRGQDWTIDTVEAVTWMLEQEAAKARPRGTPAKPDFSTAPRGWEAVRACEALDSPGQRVAMITALGIVYGLPRLVANSASDLDLPVDKAWHLSAGLVMAVLELARMQVPGWPQDDGGVPLLNSAFADINWPWHATKAGTPDWRPPVPGMGWQPVTPEEHAAAVKHGQEAEARYAETERVAAARADA